MKKTFAQVNYRRGRGRTQCGKCAMYVKHSAKAEFGTCTAVQGKISTYGVCDIWARLANPFGEGGDYRHLNDGGLSLR